MRFNSLAFRLFATAAAWTLLVLPIAGFIIYGLYRDDGALLLVGGAGICVTPPGDGVPGVGANAGAPVAGPVPGAGAGAVGAGAAGAGAMLV